MPDPAPAARFTLRTLPLPAKLVLTLFMLTVGLGYTSALVQMHFQHTEGDGSPMPGLKDVIEIFAGKRWITKEEAASLRQKSKFETLVTGPRDKWGSTSMTPAFFHKDKAFRDLVDANKGNAELIAKMELEREGERKIAELWSVLPDSLRKEAYEQDKFVPKADLPAAITKEFLHGGGIADGVKVKSILNARCVTCHTEGGDKGEFPLDTYEQIAKYLEAPEGITIPEGAAGAWCASSRQISREKLAQSTHAHLLSFAMLFTLTGLVFSFTTWPAIIRFVLSPIVLLAQVADVSCWWLARIDGPGIYFAQAIMFTGAVVGGGLALQIVLSVFNMYGLKGKFMLVLLFAAAGAGGGFVAKEYAKPFLDEEKAKKQKADEDAKKPKADPKSKPPVKGEEPKAKVEPKNPMPMSPPSRLEVLLTGDFDPKNKMNFGGSSADGMLSGGMVRAFFDKDETLKKVDPVPGSELFEKRKSEQSAMLAWVQLEDAKRKAAYESDKLPLPPSLKGKPFTQEFKADDVTVKIKTLINTRCGSCHAPDKKQEDYPLTTYAEFADYFKPE